VPYGREAAMHVQASRPKIVAPSYCGFKLPVTSMLLVTFSRKGVLMKKTTAIFITTMLAGCAQPQVIHYSTDQIAQLSNAQLCEIKNNYNPSAYIEAEVGRRNLICDPIINECLGRGNRLSTPAMALCIKEIKENFALKQELAKKEAELKQKDVQIQNQQMWDNILEQSKKNKPKQVIGADGSITQY
jgi:hypothetical protein